MTKRTITDLVTDLGFARVDHDRARRCGFPEVILGSGKTPAQVARIFATIAADADRVLATRLTPEHVAALQAKVAGVVWHEVARCATWSRPVAAKGLSRAGASARSPKKAFAPKQPGEGLVAVIAAGTADLPVAEEAVVTARIMGARVETHYDVGVAGLHRLLAVVPRLRRARALVVVAGMEGALPSVVGGLVERPVLAVPTSVGYGASLGGVAALLGMLNSCAANVSVVNIDNGFGAGYIAALINRP